MESAEESLGIDSETYNKIVDECIYGNAEQNPAWSEEDEEMLKSIVNVLEVMPSANFIPIKRETMIPWLKSIKDRYTWKPSDEQIKALLSKLPVIKGGGDKVQDILESLYQDLLKLKG